MRRLAQGLGVEAMSLYNHVANKDDLLDAMVEHGMAEVDWPPADPAAPWATWREALAERARAIHRVLLSHPWLTGLIVSRANVGPRMLRYVDATLGCLVAAGFSYPLADQAWNTLDNHIYGFTLQELNFPFEPSEYAAVAAAYLPDLSREQYPHLHALTRLVSAGGHDGVHDFELGLELTLDGLERLLGAP
jgi:AcrR family transcriptional regulator